VSVGIIPEVKWKNLNTLCYSTLKPLLQIHKIEKMLDRRNYLWRLLYRFWDFTRPIIVNPIRLFGKTHRFHLQYFNAKITQSVRCIYIYIYIYIYTGCHRRNGRNFGRVILMLKYTDITQNTYIQSWTVTEIMAREVWNFDSCYTLTDCQIHIETGRNMWFL